MVMQEFKDQQVCVIGLGYVGLTLAVVMADVGFQVLGVEIRDEVCNALASGKAHFSEPGLEQRLFCEVAHHLGVVTSHLRELVSELLEPRRRPQ